MTFLKNLHFIALTARRRSETKHTIESKPVNDCLRNLAYVIKIQQSLDQNIFYLIQRVLGIV